MTNLDLFPHSRFATELVLSAEYVLIILIIVVTGIGLITFIIVLIMKLVRHPNTPLAEDSSGMHTLRSPAYLDTDDESADESDRLITPKKSNALPSEGRSQPRPASPSKPTKFASNK